MPEITRFFGILIKMFFMEHNPPHFHALYGEYMGEFDIYTLNMLEGIYRRELFLLFVNGQNFIKKNF